MATIDIVCQVFIVVFGATGVFLVSTKKRKTKRWGFLLGLLNQPFWWITTIRHKQWGILILCIWHTFSWANGLRNHWRGDK